MPGCSAKILKNGHIQQTNFNALLFHHGILNFKVVSILTNLQRICKFDLNCQYKCFMLSSHSRVRLDLRVVQHVAINQVSGRTRYNYCGCRSAQVLIKGEDVLVPA
jgi:hypothetical protein